MSDAGWHPLLDEDLGDCFVICYWMITFVCLSLSFRGPQGADASHKSWLLPPERGSPLPGRQPDPLHSALQPGWEETRGGSALQVSTAGEEYVCMTVF